MATVRTQKGPRGLLNVLNLEITLKIDIQWFNIFYINHSQKMKDIEAEDLDSYLEEELNKEFDSIFPEVIETGEQLREIQKETKGKLKNYLDEVEEIKDITHLISEHSDKDVKCLLLILLTILNDSTSDEIIDIILSFILQIFSQREDMIENLEKLKIM